MRLKHLEINGFKSFSQKTTLEFESPIVCIVGPNGSGKSNVVEAFRFVLGEQSMKSMRGKQGLDLIFKGSKNLLKRNRATVNIYFNNTDKVFKLTNEGGEDINLNYDVINIAREVYADGVNKYILNGSEVRLKDIHNLLASVNIGSSGHHIISQGEADRILNASPRDRREMVEDALGLKIYQYKIKEAERKLERTENNMKEVGLLRRENAPHLNFLKRQVEKFEKTKEMQLELGSLYREYLKKESVYLKKEKKHLSTERQKITSELAIVDNKIKESKVDIRDVESKNLAELKVLEVKMNEHRITKNELERKLGRIEGTLESKTSRVQVSGRCPMCGNVIGEIGVEQVEKRHNEERELVELKASQLKTVTEINKLENQEREIIVLIDKCKTEISKELESTREQEREKFEWKVKHQELVSELNLIVLKEENINKASEAFLNETREGTALIGGEILAYKDFVFEGAVDAHLQEEQKRKIERIKIKLEDAGLGGGSGEIIKEYQDATERDKFLAKELEDLTTSIESLRKLMIDLKEKIDSEFKEGIKKINVEFQEFFSLMFGGGKGMLNLVVENRRKRGAESRASMDGARHDSAESGEEDEIIPENGIEIDVALPHKKVKELHALSGGERSLVSIALLFAMSQVNPPPFLVLDETDAALDEANSCKYGDMLEKLSKHSQLVVVTHNRETMSRAPVLYGVTIGSDSASKLLSVKFDQAVAIAR